MYDLTRVKFERAAVHVPEFAALQDEEHQDQEPEVVVRELTADEKRDVARSTIVRNRLAFYDTALVVFYGAVAGGLEETDKGKRLFPKLQELRDLPSEFDDALVRLANGILELSGLKERTPAPNGSGSEAELTDLELEKKD